MEPDEQFKLIAKTYRAPDGGKPAYKTWQDVKEISPGITLNTVKGWFKLNVEPKEQVWGEKDELRRPGPLPRVPSRFDIYHTRAVREPNLRCRLNYD